MRGINKITLLGHCGKDPQVNPKRTAAMVTLATKEEWTNDGGVKQKKTEWHTLQFYGGLASVASDLIKKGCKIYVEGKNQTEKWTGNDGYERTITKVVVNEFRVL